MLALCALSRSFWMTSRCSVITRSCSRASCSPFACSAISFLRAWAAISSSSIWFLKELEMMLDCLDSCVIISISALASTSSMRLSDELDNSFSLFRLLRDLLSSSTALFLPSNAASLACTASCRSLFNNNSPAHFALNASSRSFSALTFSSIACCSSLLRLAIASLWALAADSKDTFSAVSIPVRLSSSPIDWVRRFSANSLAASASSIAFWRSLSAVIFESTAASRDFSRELFFEFTAS